MGVAFQTDNIACPDCIIVDISDFAGRKGTESSIAEDIGEGAGKMTEDATGNSSESSAD